MHSYPHNSPEAAARIVALVLISDGYVGNLELEILKQLGAERELGLEPYFFPHIVHTLHEELLLNGCATDSLMGNIDDGTLASMMAEISDPALQRTVLRLSLAAARADGHLASGEAMVVEAARHHWKLFDGEETSAPKSTRRQATWPELAFNRELQPPSARPADGVARCVSGWRGFTPSRRRNVRAS